MHLIGWITIASGLWLTYKLGKLLIVLLARLYRSWRPRRLYKLAPHQNAALALAHPMAIANFENGFADSKECPLSDDLARKLRPLLKHHFGLHVDSTDAQIRVQLPARLRAGWFRTDLDALQADDQPQPAIAFACARTAFYLRVSALLGWIDADTQWLLLDLNRKRAQECFASWEEFGSAWAQGRRQWVAGSRADSFGKAFDPAQVAYWVRERGHPWRQLEWGVAAQE
ncbi:MAG: DUF1266 domain-containing protein [Burkholderiales bacterium]